jgi:YfaZ precursor
MQLQVLRAVISVQQVAAESALLTTPAYAQVSSERAATRASAQTEPGTFFVFFDTDRATLTPEEARVVAEAAEAYQDTGAARIVVSGHSDTTCVICCPTCSSCPSARALIGLLDDPDDDVVGIAPGVAARARLPFGGPPMYIASDFFYAPDILTFGDADAVVDFNVRYELQFLQNTTGFVGYRLLDFDRDGGGENDIVNTVMVGLRYAF